jgi:hypothetical protein
VISPFASLQADAVRIANTRRDVAIGPLVRAAGAFERCAGVDLAPRHESIAVGGALEPNRQTRLAASEATCHDRVEFASALEAAARSCTTTAVGGPSQRVHAGGAVAGDLEERPGAEQAVAEWCNGADMGLQNAG